MSATFGGRSAIPQHPSIAVALAMAAIVISLAVIAGVLVNVEPTFDCRAAEDRIQAFEQCRTIEGCMLSREDVWWHIVDRRQFGEKCGGE